MNDATPQSTPARRRKFDIVLYGASGFVGRQTVAYLAALNRIKGAGLRWALAGRDAVPLEQVRRAAGRGAARKLGAALRFLKRRVGQAVSRITGSRSIKESTP